MARAPRDLQASEFDFLRERHLATLTTLRRDGTPHVVPVAFVYREGTVSILARDGGQKVVNVEAGSRAAVCQVEGGRWLTMEGPARIARDPDVVADAVSRYEQRFRPVSENPERVIIEITVDRVLGRA